MEDSNTNSLSELRIQLLEETGTLCTTACRLAFSERHTCSCVCRGQNHGKLRKRLQTELQFEEEITYQIGSDEIPNLKESRSCMTF